MVSSGFMPFVKRTSALAVLNTLSLSPSRTSQTQPLPNCETAPLASSFLQASTLPKDASASMSSAAYEDIWVEFSRQFGIAQTFGQNSSSAEEEGSNRLEGEGSSGSSSGSKGSKRSEPFFVRSCLSRDFAGFNTERSRSLKPLMKVRNLLT